jgi:hypothetical protein
MLETAFGTVRQRVQSIILRVGTYTVAASLGTNDPSATATLVGVRTDTSATIVMLSKSGAIGPTSLATYVNTIDGLEVVFYLSASVADAAALLSGITVHKS